MEGNTSWLKELGITDLFGIYADYQKNRLAANGQGTINDLQNQVSLLTMQRDTFNSYAQMMAQQTMTQNNVTPVNWMPLVLIGGVVVVAVMFIGNK